MGNKGVEATKKMSTNASGDSGKALKIAANTNQNPRSATHNVIKFYHTGEEKYLGKIEWFSGMATFQWVGLPILYGSKNAKTIPISTFLPSTELKERLEKWINEVF